MNKSNPGIKGNASRQKNEQVCTSLQTADIFTAYGLATGLFSSCLRVALGGLPGFPVS